MKAISFNIISNSLFSIRIPFTWQSAITYPMLPPSAVIGMLANALQRYKNDKHPIEHLKNVEGSLIWAGSRLLSPCVIKSYTMSAVVKWGDKLGGKFTNALGRQFSYSRNLKILAIFKDDSLVNEIAKAVKLTPLTCGDSESPISVETEVEICEARFSDIKDEIRTDFPAPFSKDVELNGIGKLFLVHERCLKTGKSFPLKSYIFPIKENDGILEHSQLEISSISNEFKVIEVGSIGRIILKVKQESE